MQNEQTEPAGVCPEVVRGTTRGSVCSSSKQIKKALGVPSATFLIINALNGYAPFFKPTLYVESEQYNISVGNYIFLTFRPYKTFFLGSNH